MRARVKTPILEEWLPIPDCYGYAVSDHGRVYSWKSGKYLSSKPSSLGYVQLFINGKPHKVHRLVLSAFVGPRPPSFFGCHLNAKKDDNRLANLKWGSARENNRERAADKKKLAKQYPLLPYSVLFNLYRL